MQKKKTCIILSKDGITRYKLKNKESRIFFYLRGRNKQSLEQEYFEIQRRCSLHNQPGRCVPPPTPPPGASLQNVHLYI